MDISLNLMKDFTYYKNIKEFFVRIEEEDYLYSEEDLLIQRKGVFFIPQIKDIKESEEVVIFTGSEMFSLFKKGLVRVKLSIGCDDMIIVTLIYLKMLNEDEEQAE